VAVLLQSQSQWDAYRNAVEEATDDSLGGYEFAEETDFSTESIVVIEKEIDSLKRLRLAAVTGVGTESPHLCVSTVDAGTGNAIVTRLLLVRLPHRGTQPTTAVIGYRDDLPDGKTTTLVAEPYSGSSDQAILRTRFPSR
jgi:hypothetical protein